ncbi:hypothetical protein TNIN_186411 [Trichonephila inaurata madagascariensis]|uniref:Uncharacterized protein n=1 Tax=Trichonephila inaurata madagascariensis TaxID=2747483 RepID=A0A8X7BUD0_9ARAC|nr:hypothetical protein TNIN_186411 [Trichonephila inaurata madagascariensis]
MQIGTRRVCSGANSHRDFRGRKFRGFQRIDENCCPLTNVEYWSTSLASCCSCEQILVGVGGLGLVGVRGSMSRRLAIAPK